MTFTETGLHALVLQGLTDAGYTTPTPVQAEAIPAALAGRDLLVSSQTGSGKTAAYMLPALHLLATQARPARNAPSPRREGRGNADGRPARRERQHFLTARPRVLVLAPTRELAQQVTGACDKYGRHLRQIRAVAILGGMPYPKQLELLGRDPEIIVATPGRLIDHMQSGRIDLSELRMLVLDEADRMLDMGFVDEIDKIVAATPDNRQTMLYSATLEGAVGQIAQRVTRDALRIRIDAVEARQDHIEQRLHFVDDLEHKNRLLDHLLRDVSIDQAVVFTATKREADVLSDRLNLAGFSAAPLHGDMPQRARNRTLIAMHRRNIRILVATDVAARGIDIPSITHVFNYDLPKFAEDYVHRIGRTGRAGRHGVAISLAHHAEQGGVRRIERFTRQAIPVETIAGYEPVRGRPAATTKRRPGKPADAARKGKAPWHKKAESTAEHRRGYGYDSRGAQDSSPHGDKRPAKHAPQGAANRSRGMAQPTGNRPAGPGSLARSQRPSRSH